MDISRRMLKTIRQKQKELNEGIELPCESLVESKIGKCLLTEEDQPKLDKENIYVIKKSDAEFGQLKTSQEDAIRKAVSGTKFEDDSLKYYKDIKDLVINGSISGINVKFQFRYKDPSGDGCYIWCDGMQLTDANLRSVQKIRDAFQNWKSSLDEDADLFEKLHKRAKKNDD